MFEGERPTGSKPEIYRELALMAEGLFRGERDPIANAANLSALLWMGLTDLNWAGFYFLRGSILVLGPFQGKPACVRIEPGKGVCGSAAAKKKTLIVPDVEAFPGHIACDIASRSELVVPLLQAAGLQATPRKAIPVEPFRNRKSIRPPHSGCACRARAGGPAETTDPRSF